MSSSSSSSSSTPLPPGYKFSELGPIPDDWEVKELGGITKIKKGQILTAQDSVFGDIPVIAGGKDPAFYHNISNRKKNVITISASGANAGYVNFFTTPIFASDCSTIEENINFSIKFIYFYLSFLQEEIYNLQTGGAQPHVYSKHLATLKISLPTNPTEQSAIADVLSDTDTLITQLDTLITKYQDLKTAFMAELLTARLRFPGFTDDWEVKELGEVAGFKNGYAFKSSKYTKNGKFRIITIANVQQGYMTIEEVNKIDILPKNIQKSQILQPNDILISMTGNIGRVCLVNQGNCLLNQRVGKIIFAKINKFLGFYILSNPKFIKQLIGKGQGGAQDNIGKRDIMEYKFPLPTNPTEQSAIADVLSDFDHHISTLTAKRDKYISIKQALMADLLTGRRRIPL